MNSELLSEMAINFPLWKECLLRDARLHPNREMRARFKTLSDHVLHRLWFQGARPSVQGILDHCLPED